MDQVLLANAVDSLPYVILPEELPLTEPVPQFTVSQLAQLQDQMRKVGVLLKRNAWGLCVLSQWNDGGNGCALEKECLGFWSALEME